VKIVEVEWVDAWIDSSDFTMKEAKKLKPIPRKTVGYLIAENDDCIVLSTDYFPKEKNEVSACMVIPTGWIKKTCISGE
jgi:hypothetical protein